MSITDTNEQVDYSVNEVKLVGWVTTIAMDRELPNGDLVTSFRIAITRPEGGVDTIDLEAWSQATRKKALKLKDGEWVAITGSIRRRFWKSGAGLASQWSVVTKSIKKVEVK